MARIELIMPKMGESITEATILNWVKNVGDTIEMDETILEIATDKVDSEIPSPASGKIIELFYKVDDVVEVGKVIAIIATEGEDVVIKSSPAIVESLPKSTIEPNKSTIQDIDPPQSDSGQSEKEIINHDSGDDKFFSPLVKSIAKKENISLAELNQIIGTGANGRVNKKDILTYLSNRSSDTSPIPAIQNTNIAKASVSKDNTTNSISSKTQTSSKVQKNAPISSENVEIIEMDRMRRLIADHMVMSKHTSPHVTSFVEVDVTDIVNWRNKIKNDFIKKHHQKITFTPIFMDAIIKAIQDFPMVNVSVEGNKIIKKNDINLGMATALPSGNLIVPVIKNADNLNLLGLVKSVNDLANRARENKLSPTDIQGGTFTMTNVGTFGNVMGTPIINQPQAAILAVGAIRKKPAVLETKFGDVIAIRHMMYMSLSYDHRVVDGFLGGSFLRKIGDYLEDFDIDMEI